MLQLKAVGQEKIFNNNLAALKNRYPQLYQKVIAASDKYSSNVFRMKQDDVFPNLLINNKEGIFYYDPHDPMGYCKGYIGSLSLNYAPIAVFFGFGLGYQVVAALQDFSKTLNIKHIIIVEKDIELFRAALKVLDLSQVIEHPDIKFFVGIESDDFFSVFRRHFSNTKIAGFFKCLKVITMPAAHLMDRQYYRDVFELLKFSIKHLLQSLGNEPYDSLLGLEHNLTNLVPMIENPGIITFKDAFKAKPAIIVGAGPSLKKNIQILKEGYFKALIVATDAALKPLLKAGVKPHLVATIERTLVTVDFYSGLDGLEKMFFVFCPLIYRETYDCFKGRKIVAHRYPEYLEWLKLPKGVLNGGSVVGNFVFDVAQFLGCDPIIMVGQDLSFKPTGLTHIFGNVEGYRKNTIEVEGNDGEILMTTRDFEASRRSLEMQIDEFGGMCINATEGGVKIKGTICLSLREAMRDYCHDSFDYYRRLEDIWNKKKPTEEDTAIEIKKVHSVLYSAISQFGSIVNDCQKGLNLINSVENEHELLRDRKPNPICFEIIENAYNELDEIREKIISNPDFLALSNIFSPYHSYFEMEKNALSENFHHPEFSRLKSFLMLKEWFSIIGQLCLSTQFSLKRACYELDTELTQDLCAAL